MSRIHDRSAEASADSINFLDRRPAFVPMIFIAIVALIGAGRMPIEYYDFLCAAMIAGGLLVIAHAIASGKYVWIALGLPMAVIWSPGSQISFDRPVWQLLDIVAAIAALVAGTMIPAAKSKQQADGSWTMPWAWWKFTGVAALVGFFMFAGLSQPDYSGLDYIE